MSKDTLVTVDNAQYPLELGTELRVVLVRVPLAYGVATAMCMLDLLDKNNTV